MFPTSFSDLERRRLLTICAILLCALSLPYLWAWLLSPGDGVYAGFLYNPDDQNVHLSWARQAHDGASFFRDLFTTESFSNGEKPLFHNALSWVIGNVSRFTTIPLIFVYHAFRVVFSLLAIWWFAALCAHITTDKRVRLTAVSLAAFGGGASFLGPLFPGRIFIDRAETGGAFPMMPEAFTFASAFVFPLFIVSVALLVLVYLQTLRAQENNSWKSALSAMFAAFLLTNIHTYDAIPLDIVMLIWAISSTRFARGDATNVQALRMRVVAPLLVILATLPMLLYQRFVLFANSEEFRVKALSVKPAPPFFDLFLSLSPLLILAILAVWFVCKKRHESENNHQKMPAMWLMTLWTFVTLALVYTPTSVVSFARKMIEGVHLPLCLLAAFGLIAILDALKTSQKLNRVLVTVFVALMSWSSLNFVGWCLNNARDNNATRGGLMPPLYLPNEANAAINFLNALPDARDRAILCSPLWGNYIPPKTGFAVYVGHFDETLHFTQKLGEAQRFYNGKMNVEESLKWLHKNHIAFVIIGPNELALGARKPAFPVVWQGGNTTIYRVP